MISDSLALLELADINDPLLLPWLDLYEISFPCEQRLPVSRILRWLREPRPTNEGHRHFLALMDAGESARLLGIIDCYERDDLPAAFLWYFAIQPGERGRGLGGYLYQRLLARLPAGTRALIFDVEDPAAEPNPSTLRRK